MHGLGDGETLLGAPEKGCNFAGDQRVETFGEGRRQGLGDTPSATTTVIMTLGLMVLGHEVNSQKILEAEKKDSSPAARSSGTTKVSEHLGALKKVEIREG
jgi:hypothetical protein